MTTPGRLAARFNSAQASKMDPDQLLAQFKIQPAFAQASFETYEPDPDYPSQAEAASYLRSFVELMGRKPTPIRALSRFFDPTWNVQEFGVYLDGGFGVGKTHLLTSSYRLAPEPKLIGAFSQFTSLIGALGYAKVQEMLAGYRFIAIDEFELDDPGDTMMMTRLLRDLKSAGCRVAITSNTSPKDLGAGRFSAADFQREITSLANDVSVLRIDGADYRQKEGIEPDWVSNLNDTGWIPPGMDGDCATEDDFADLLSALQGTHPSRFASALTGLRLARINRVEQITDLSTALRFVSLIDRMYEVELAILICAPPASLFSGELLASGFHRKFERAISRFNSLTRTGMNLLL